MQQYIFEIEKKEDYQKFYSHYIDSKNCLKETFHGDKFLFKIIFSEDIDECLLFEFYLIADKYCSKTETFEVECFLPENLEKQKEDEFYYRLSTYAFIEQNIYKNRGKIVCKGKDSRKFSSTLSGIKRLVPAFSVNASTLEFLRQPIDENVWNKISDGKKEKITTIEDVIYYLCWRFLFGPVGSGNSTLQKLRVVAFKSDDFKSLVDNIPLIAILIFSMLDYSFREEAVEKYKSKIRNAFDKKRVKLALNDFLYELQDKQNWKSYEIYKKIKEDGYNNKTIFKSYAEKKIHPYIVKELYEAITISEGILQLLENIVNHAGENNSGTGIISMYIHNYDRDLEMLNKKQPKYIDYLKNEAISAKYLLEILIADLSGTTIPDKFSSNNKEFFEENRREIEKKMKDLGGEGGIPEKFYLKSFFSPTKNENIFWTAFFSFGDKAVNHYGLQIFDSIISSKHGLFIVESGTEQYENIAEKNNSEDGASVHGSRYTIMCPLNGATIIDDNIYDSMFGYDYIQNVKLKTNKIEPLCSDFIPKTMEEKQMYIETVNDKIKNIVGEEIIVADVREFKSLECLVKGVLLYIFGRDKNCESDRILIFFQNCQPHEIINIVRILAVFYNKQGENDKMGNVQIYIRGQAVGEEIIFHGKTLQEVRNNIEKGACMRGIMFDNLQAINRILERANKEKKNDD